MKQFLFIFLFLFSVTGVIAQPAQQKPLTQSEYVRMLYVLENDGSKMDEVIAAVRTRGIGFVLTDGLRSLTRTKSRNDAELQRTLEESDRRRSNPGTSKIPSEEEARDILEKAREVSLAALEDMPDFTVKELISRGYSFSGRNNWNSLDNLTIAVNYSSTKGEQYRVLAINGAIVNASAGNSYSGLDGATTSGEFVEDLKNIFDIASKTKFKVIDTDLVRNQAAIVYEFRIALENNKGGGVAIKNRSALSERFVVDMVPTGSEGKIWIDRKTFRVLRFQYSATDIPPKFPIKKFTTNIDYDWVVISGNRYLLPLISEARFTSASQGELFDDRNLIRFKNYQKYGTEITILDDDAEVVPEEPPVVKKP